MVIFIFLVSTSLHLMCYNTVYAGIFADLFLWTGRQNIFYCCKVSFDECITWPVIIKKIW